jgi:predicted nuclease of restriction endonuclease-like (RecB) superfamily
MYGLFDRVKDREERLCYAHAAIENGWSRNALGRTIQCGFNALLSA